MNKLAHLLKACIPTVLVTIIFFGLAEIVARLVFPEFAGQIHSATQTLGKNFYLTKDPPIRIPSKNYALKIEKPLVIVLGDSISHGYGMAYEDIYWVRLQHMLKLEQGSQAPEFLSLSYYGNNLQDSVGQIEKYLKQHENIQLKEIIYQFNFNDIVPEVYGRQGLHKLPSRQQTSQVSQADSTGTAASAGADAMVSQSSEKARFLTSLRAEYMNYSVFLRVAQHYAGKLTRKTSGDCMARDLNALGPYTWTYGSKKYAAESQVLWKNFSAALEELKKVADAKGAKLSIVVSPLLFDIDRKGYHAQYNYLNYDFSCATVDPRAKLVEIATSLGVALYDPTQYMRESFEARMTEGNFTPYFLTADENHLSPLAASMMAEYLFANLAKNQQNYSPVRNKRVD
jgi:lysophospholipase L1-like esterase